MYTRHTHYRRRRRWRPRDKRQWLQLLRARDNGKTWNNETRVCVCARRSPSRRSGGGLDLAYKNYYYKKWCDVRLPWLHACVRCVAIIVDRYVVNTINTADCTTKNTIFSPLYPYIIQYYILYRYEYTRY